MLIDIFSTKAYAFITMFHCFSKAVDDPGINVYGSGEFM